MKITKGTIVRTILLLMAVVNFTLERMGITIIPVSESGVLMLVETLLEIAVIVVGFWKNNSYTKNAIKADEFLKELKNSEVQ